MIGYASRTGTRQNLEALKRAGWRLIVSPTGELRTEGFRYALENGAWTAHCNGVPFDDRLFLRAVDQLGHAADWIALPDIVAGGLRSLAFSLQWRERLNGAHLLLPVQDGLHPAHIRALLGPTLGIFVGGSTVWKISTMAQWGELAAEVGCWMHVGRVNTARRIHLCAAAGAHSFDGSSASRYRVTLALLDNARHQPDLFTPSSKPS